MRNLERTTLSRRGMGDHRWSLNKAGCWPVRGNRLVPLLVGLLLLLWLPLPVQAQSDETIPLTIRLRAADGTAVAGEPVRLERLPAEILMEPACRTDAAGACHWRVGRGLYQLLLERPLDPVTRLALAEGGLRGFGLTVGQEPVAYHFTLHRDGHLYFDVAPGAAMPVPVIPMLDEHHEPVAIVTPPTPTSVMEPTATGTPAAAIPTESDASFPAVRLLLFLGLGLLTGGGLHLWARRRQAIPHSAIRNSEELPIPHSESPHA